MGSVPKTINPLIITTTKLPVAIVNTSYTTTLAVTGGLGPFTWTITSGSLPAGINLSSSGVISGTATATGSSSFTVQVTDSQTPTAAVATAGLTLTVNDQLSITTTSLRVGAVNVPYVVFLTASGGATPYAWSVISGSLPAGLTLSAAGVISGTPTTEGTSNFTVQVTDSESPAATATQALSITIGGSMARLSGNYAFSFHGFRNGLLVLEAGSFISDGNGNITSGVADMVSTNKSFSQINSPLTGTYTIDDTGHGTMTLTYTRTGYIGVYQLASAAGGYFSFIQDGDGQSTQSGTGIIKLQNLTNFTLSSFNGNWAFGGYGADLANARYAAAGTYTLTVDNTGNSAAISNGVLDSNDNGTFKPGNALAGAFAAPDLTTGRGTASFGPGILTGASLAYYVVSSSEVIIVDTQPVINSTPLIMYSALQQPGNLTFSNGVLLGNVMSELAAVANGSVPDASLGLFNFDGKGTFKSSIDENQGGTLSQSTPTGTYAVTSTGRTTFTGWGSSLPILYLTTFNAGFVLGTDASVTFGQMEEWSVRQPSNSVFSGTYAGGTILPALASQTVRVDIANADGAGNLTDTYDIAGGGNPPQQGLTLKATYNVDSTSARFTLVDSNNNTVGIGYVVSNVSGLMPRVVIMTTDSQPTFSVLEQ